MLDDKRRVCRPFWMSQAMASTRNMTVAMLCCYWFIWIQWHLHTGHFMSLKLFNIIWVGVESFRSLGGYWLCMLSIITFCQNECSSRRDGRLRGFARCSRAMMNFHSDLDVDPNKRALRLVRAQPVASEWDWEDSSDVWGFRSEIWEGRRSPESPGPRLTHACKLSGFLRLTVSRFSRDQSPGNSDLFVLFTSTFGWFLEEGSSAALPWEAATNKMAP